MKMGAYTKRQKQASTNHDAGNEVASQIATGVREIEVIDADNWKIAAATGIGKYNIKRERCKRICAVCLYKSQTLFCC
jgi:hypothetical protein